MPHWKSLIFNCLSFTEGLITCSSKTDSEAPVLSIYIYIYTYCNYHNCMAAINSLNRLICNKHGENIRRVASCCNYLIKLKQQILILVEFVTISILLI
jgi:hypothetical protein